MAENKTAKTPTDGGTGFNYFRASPITVLRLPQEPVGRHEPEPMAWKCQCGKSYTVTCISSKPSKQWVGLTDDAVFELADTNLYDGGKNFGVLAFAKAIEQALKEKNA